jgi:hypothetical protein
MEKIIFLTHTVFNPSNKLGLSVCNIQIGTGSRNRYVYIYPISLIEEKQWKIEILFTWSTGVRRSCYVARHQSAKGNLIIIIKCQVKL